MNRIRLLGETKEKMVDELRGKKKTAKEFADSLGIQVSAARRHLEALSDLSIVKEKFVQDGIGRPKKFYELTDVGYELFPRQYERVLCSLLDEIESSDKVSKESILKAVAHEVAQEMHIDGEALGNEKRRRVEELAKALDEFGFDSTAEEREGCFVLTSHNCPLFNAAKKHQRMVCHGFHDEIIKSALGTRDVKLEKCVARGDEECRHVIGSNDL